MYRVPFHLADGTINPFEHLEYIRYLKNHPEHDDMVNPLEKAGRITAAQFQTLIGPTLAQMRTYQLRVWNEYVLQRPTDFERCKRARAATIPIPG